MQAGSRQGLPGALHAAPRDQLAAVGQERVPDLLELAQQLRRAEVVDAPLVGPVLLQPAAGVHELRPHAGQQPVGLFGVQRRKRGSTPGSARGRARATRSAPGSHPRSAPTTTGRDEAVDERERAVDSVGVLEVQPLDAVGPTFGCRRGHRRSSCRTRADGRRRRARAPSRRSSSASASSTSRHAVATGRRGTRPRCAPRRPRWAPRCAARPSATAGRPAPRAARGRVARRQGLLVLPVLEQGGDADHLVEHGTACCLRGVGREHRPHGEAGHLLRQLGVGISAAAIRSTACVSQLPSRGRRRGRVRGAPARPRSPGGSRW